MIVFQSGDMLQNWLQKRDQTAEISFVPTMGALHQGHLSLLSIAREHAAISVCSIFVNPTQFNDPADFEKYPKTIEKDLEKLEKAGCTAVFLPTITEIYPHGTSLTKYYDLGFLETIFEGKYRLGHFQGVCQVVERLLQIVQPHYLILGQKDLQQCRVLQQLTQTKAFYPPVTIIIGTTLREQNGLAMSSRNMRLSASALVQAGAIYKQMQWVKEQLQIGSLNVVLEQVHKQLLLAGFESIDYCSLVNTHTLAELDSWDGETSVTMLVAAYLDGVRLIDNCLIV
jgi:pantoate--beta-alanine ligase